MFAEIRCADPRVPFSGEWSGAESPAEIVAQLRQKSQRLGFPIQVRIDREGIRSTAPTPRPGHTILVPREMESVLPSRPVLRQRATDFHSSLHGEILNLAGT